MCFAEFVCPHKYFIEMDIFDISKTPIGGVYCIAPIEDYPSLVFLIRHSESPDESQSQRLDNLPL